MGRGARARVCIGFLLVRGRSVRSLFRWGGQCRSVSEVRVVGDGERLSGEVQGIMDRKLVLRCY